MKNLLLIFCILLPTLAFAGSKCLKASLKETITLEEIPRDKLSLEERNAQAFPKSNCRFMSNFYQHGDDTSVLAKDDLQAIYLKPLHIKYDFMTNERRITYAFFNDAEDCDGEEDSYSWGQMSCPISSCDPVSMDDVKFPDYLVVE